MIESMMSTYRRKLNIGDIRREATKQHTASFVWTILNYFSLPQDEDYVFYSPEFTFMDANWRFMLSPNGETELNSIGWIELYLRKVSSPTANHLVSFKIGIRKTDGTEFESYSEMKNFQGNGDGWGTKKLVQRSELRQCRREIASSDKLRVFCVLLSLNCEINGGCCQTDLLESREEVWDNGQTSASVDRRSKIMDEDSSFRHVPGVKILVQNLKDLFVNGQGTDATLEVSDRQFLAHRVILSARSPVFEAMFRHDTSESRSGMVKIIDCDPNAFREFLVYLYTGEVDNLTADNVQHLYRAADKYDAGELKALCVRFMTYNLSVDTICDVLALSLKHGEQALLQKATRFFARNLKQILVTVKWQSFVRENPVAANELYIKALDLCDISTSSLHSNILV